MLGKPVIFLANMDVKLIHKSFARLQFFKGGHM